MITAQKRRKIAILRDRLTYMRNELDFWQSRSRNADELNLSTEEAITCAIMLDAIILELQTISFQIKVLEALS